MPGTRISTLKQITALTALLTTSRAHSEVQSYVARQADELVGSIGVCTHWDYLDTVYGKRFSEIRKILLESGIRNVRDGGGSDRFLARVRDLAGVGIRTTLIMDPGQGIVPNDNYWTPTSAKRTLLVDFLKRGGVKSFGGVEMLNEIDLFHSRDGFVHDFTQAGLFWKPGDTTPDNKLTDDSKSPMWWKNYAVEITKDSYQAMKADPATGDIPVIGPSLGRTYGYDTKSPIGSGTLEKYVDWGCFHPYPTGGNPFSGRESYGGLKWYFGNGTQPSVNIDEAKAAFDIYQPPFGAKPMCATETGWYTGTAKGAISEELQRKYVPRLFFEYFRKGVRRTFHYELVDLWDNKADDQSCRGLMHNDLTPKPAFTDLTGVIRLLSDPGPAFAPKPLAYDLEVRMPEGYDRRQYVRAELFAKRDGSYWLALYHEIAGGATASPDGDPLAGPCRTISHPDVSVTIRPAPGSGIHTASLWSLANPFSPVTTFNSAAEIHVTVTDEVKMLELVP